MLICTMSTCQTTAGCVCQRAADEIEAERAACRRMILAAHQQAAESAIRWLELVEKYGMKIVPVALKEMRAKAAAYGSAPLSSPKAEGVDAREEQGTAARP